MLSLAPRVGLISKRRAPASTAADCAFIGLARHHQLPGDPGDLVGQRHRGQLRRLALEQRHQPGRAAHSGRAAPAG